MTVPNGTYYLNNSIKAYKTKNTIMYPTKGYESLEVKQGSIICVVAAEKNPFWDFDYHITFINETGQLLYASIRKDFIEGHFISTNTPT